jgi:hypothetical protein
MQIFSDALVEEQQKHTSNQSSNNNSIPSSLGVDSADHAPQNNIIKRHSFTNAVPKPAATAPLLSTPENRSVNLSYSNGGSLKVTLWIHFITHFFDFRTAVKGR